MRMRTLLPLTVLFGFVAHAHGQQSATPAESDPELIEVRPVGTATRFAVFYSGDGGWAAIDRGVADELAEQGTLIVGVNSLRYFARERTPEEAAADLTRILDSYDPRRAHLPVLLIGFSRGASVLPLIVNHLPEAVRGRITAISLIAPERKTQLKVQLRDLLPGLESRGEDVAPQIKMLKVPTQCIYGEGDSDALCPDLKGPAEQAVAIGAGHHLSGEYGAIADCIISHADTAVAASTAR